MTPVRDLSQIAAAGREARQRFQMRLPAPETAETALSELAITLLFDLGHGGKFDFQRKGSFLFGYSQYPQFRDVSNFNVGLLCQQSGLTLEETLTVAGHFAHFFSSNYAPNEPYGVDARDRKFIERGSLSGASGVFESKQNDL